LLAPEQKTNPHSADFLYEARDYAASTFCAAATATPRWIGAFMRPGAPVADNKPEAGKVVRIGLTYYPATLFVKD